MIVLLLYLIIQCFLCPENLQEGLSGHSNPPLLFHKLLAFFLFFQKLVFSFFLNLRNFFIVFLKPAKTLPFFFQFFPRSLNLRFRLLIFSGIPIPNCHHAQNQKIKFGSYFYLLFFISQSIFLFCIHI